MKKIFAFVAVAMAALTVNAQDSFVYYFDNQASTYKLGDNCEATTYKMDSVDGFSVNYTGAATANKMQLMLAADESIFFEYSNSSTKNNVIKTGLNYLVCDSKNFVLNVPVIKDDMLYIKFSAKGDKAAKVQIYGTEPCVETTCVDSISTAKSDTKIFVVKATKEGTAKIKEYSNGMRVYAIGINDDLTSVAENKVAAAKAAKFFENGKVVILKNGVRYNVLGAKL